MPKHTTKIIGILLALFGALQLMSEQIRTLISPEAYGWYTIAVGVALVVLGAIKRVEGSFLTANKTWIAGVVLAGLGALQQYSELFSSLLGAQAFQMFNIGIGLAVAVIGYWNTLQAQESTP